MATYKEFLVSGDCHIIEPPDLFKTRLPQAHARPGAVGRGLRPSKSRSSRAGTPSSGSCTPSGFDGWTVSRYRQFEGHDGTTPGWIPTTSSRDMDLRRRRRRRCCFPNLSLFALYTDDHELSIAHARVYND